MPVLQTEETPPMSGPILTLEPPPKPKPVENKPAAENPPIHHPDAPPTTEDVLRVPSNPDATPTTGKTISFQPVDEPVPDAPPAREPVAEPPAVRVIRNPSWVRQPTAEQMTRAYPDRAIDARIAGSVSLNCMVEANGSVSGCSVVGETPAGQGFGRAAQTLSRHFRINPRTVDGNAEGSRVAINLRFVPPAE
jgi:protein TonB